MVTKFGHVIMTSAEARGILKTHADNETRIEQLEATGRAALELVASYMRITDGLVTALTSIPCETGGDCDPAMDDLCPVCTALVRAQAVVMEHSEA
jgi:hypothetical protein